MCKWLPLTKSMLWVTVPVCTQWQTETSSTLPDIHSRSAYRRLVAIQTDISELRRSDRAKSLRWLIQPYIIRHHLLIIPQNYAQTSYVILMQLNRINIYNSSHVLYIKFAFNGQKLRKNKQHYGALMVVYDSLRESLDHGVWITERITWSWCMTH